MYQIKLHHIFEFVFITAEVPEVYVLALDKMAFEYCLRMGGLKSQKGWEPLLYVKNCLT